MFRNMHKEKMRRALNETDLEQGSKDKNRPLHFQHKGQSMEEKGMKARKPGKNKTQRQTLKSTTKRQFQNQQGKDKKNNSCHRETEKKLTRTLKGNRKYT